MRNRRFSSPHPTPPCIRTRRSANHGAPGTAPNALSLLTRRERELVELSLTGKTYPAVAAALGLAPSTVKRAFGVIRKKLGVHSREQLAAALGKE
mgnify:CR=1 FL=1